eukprot:1178051-Prorocentrum_minimum.AAC.7
MKGGGGGPCPNPCSSACKLSLCIPRAASCTSKSVEPSGSTAAIDRFASSSSLIVCPDWSWSREGAGQLSSCRPSASVRVASEEGGGADAMSLSSDVASLPAAGFPESAPAGARGRCSGPIGWGSQLCCCCCCFWRSCSSRMTTAGSWPCDNERAQAPHAEGGATTAGAGAGGGATTAGAGAGGGTATAGEGAGDGAATAGAGAGDGAATAGTPGWCMTWPGVVTTSTRSSRLPVVTRFSGSVCRGGGAPGDQLIT